MSTNASLCISIVDFVQGASNKYTVSTDESEASGTSACIEFREICLIFWASLANILDDDQTREASADSVNKMLVESARVNTYTLIKNGIVLITFGAFATEAIDGLITLLTVAIESIDVEDFVGSAPVAHGFIASVDFDGSGFAVGTVVVIIAVAVVVGQCSHCQQHNQEEALSHCQFISIRI